MKHLGVGSSEGTFPNKASELKVEDLSVSYGRDACFENVSIVFPKNRVTAIVGPSGCGKSSLLAALNRTGELQSNWKSGGQITLDGDSVDGKKVDLNFLRRKIGLICQRPNPFPFSIAKNIQLGLREHGIAKKDWATITESVLSEVGLWEEVKGRLGDSALKLSGGQQQRLCIARALALSPSVLLFDEPCSALDPVATSKIEALIEKLKSMMTVVIVTHNIGQAKRISDQVVMFWYQNGKGEVVEIESSEKFFSGPSHPASQQFLSGLEG